MLSFRPNATANGDTRTISFHHIHLKEDTTVTFKVNGKYDQAALRRSITRSGTGAPASPPKWTRT